MTKTNTILLSVLIAAVVLVGGGIIYSMNRSDESAQTTNNSQPDQENVEQNPGDEPAESATPAENTAETQTIEGVAVPNSVVAAIERDYPDYVIDDVDREVSDGVVYYKIDLEHRTPGNDSEYELTYSESWELLEANFDRD